MFIIFGFSREWYLRRVSESHKNLFECLDNHLLPSHHAFVLLREQASQHCPSAGELLEKIAKKHSQLTKDSLA